MRLIDADALITQDWYVQYIGNLEEDQVKDIIQQCKWYVMNAPTIEIVRCKECKHRQNPYAPKWCYEMSKETDADDFCSYGERDDTRQ